MRLFASIIFFFALTTQSFCASLTPIKYGTGFFVNQDGYFVSDAHVLPADKCQGADAITSDGKSYHASISRVDPKLDLLIGKVAKQHTSFLPFAKSSLLGEQVATFGFPFAGLLSEHGNFTVGNYSAEDGGLVGGQNTIQITTPLQPGNSGGAVVNFYGETTAVVVTIASSSTFLKATGTVPMNVGFATKGEIVRAFLSVNHVSYTSSENKIKLEPTDLAQITKQSTVRLICLGVEEPDVEEAK